MKEGGPLSNRSRGGPQQSPIMANLGDSGNLLKGPSGHLGALLWHCWGLLGDLELSRALIGSFWGFAGATLDAIGRTSAVELASPMSKQKLPYHEAAPFRCGPDGGGPWCASLSLSARRCLQGLRVHDLLPTVSHDLFPQACGPRFAFMCWRARICFQGVAGDDLLPGVGEPRYASKGWWATICFQRLAGQVLLPGFVRSRLSGRGRWATICFQGWVGHDLLPAGCGPEFALGGVLV